MLRGTEVCRESQTKAAATAEFDSLTQQQRHEARKMIFLQKTPKSENPRNKVSPEDKKKQALTYDCCCWNNNWSLLSNSDIDYFRWRGSIRKKQKYTNYFTTEIKYKTCCWIMITKRKKVNVSGANLVTKMDLYLRWWVWLRLGLCYNSVIAGIQTVVSKHQLNTSSRQQTPSRCKLLSVFSCQSTGPGRASLELLGHSGFSRVPQGSTGSRGF